MAVALPGPIQTTPRAELYAIWLALVFGASPQLIISDHNNHVQALRDMKEGIYKVLNPMTPNVDLWRKVVKAVKDRCGMCEDGPNQLWIDWQPSHTRASSDETMDMKNRRRGNAAVDSVANDGRKLHEDVNNKVARVQYLHHVAKQSALWAGAAAALQYSDKFEGCDHDVRPKNAPKCKPHKPMKVELPKEAKVIRKFPWATRSLGTAEYIGDLHSDGHNGDESVDTRLACAVRKAAGSTMVGAKYNEGFDRNVSRSKIMGKRILTRSVPEYARPLSQEDAYGHQLYVTGLLPTQYFYCEKCSAYTGMRAQNLMKPCTGYRYPSRAVNRLREGKHPITGVHLETLPRRVTRRDVGNDLWCGDPLPAPSMHYESVDSDHNATSSACDDCIAWHDVCLPQAHLTACISQEEDDPLGLGCSPG